MHNILQTNRPSEKNKHDRYHKQEFILHIKQFYRLHTVGCVFDVLYTLCMHYIVHVMYIAYHCIKNICKSQNSSD